MSFSYQQGRKYSSVGNWLLINVLGDGGSATVFLGYNPKTKIYSAIKIFKDLDLATLSDAKSEAQTQSSLDHRRISKVRDFNETAELVDTTGKRQRVCYMELELARGGDLFLLVQRVKAVTEKLARTYFHQLVEILEYLQQEKVVHGDIKLENLMLDANFCLKLTDFGCATHDFTEKRLLSSGGTSRYLPPERHQQKAYNGASGDIFAAGVVLFCLVCGEMPFSRAQESDYFYYLLAKGKHDVFWKAHEEMAVKRGLKVSPSAEFKELINGILEADAKKRFTLNQIKQTAWYRLEIYDDYEVKELVTRMIN